MKTIHLYKCLCVVSFLSYTVNAVCPDNCNTCENYDKCTSCKSYNWNLNVSCASTCSSSCLNQECQDDNGYCHQCKTGLYGIQCQRDCSFCEQELCDLRACTLGCKFGYYSFSDGSETFCQTCQTDCRTCRNSYVCDVCNDGFYLYKHMFNSKIYGPCSPCPDSSQSCKDLCAIQDCNKCQVLPDKIVCSECREGFEFNGDICVMKITECSKGCSTSCDDNGICLGSCNTGWSNERCSESCANQCLTCSRNNTNVCEQCKGDFYTTGCNIECPGHCNRMMSKQVCRIDGGYCLNGCERSFWGPFCNMTCPDGCSDDGISKFCEESNGSCTLGCKDGFTGSNCDMPVLTTPTVKEPVRGSVRLVRPRTPSGNCFATVRSKAETPSGSCFVIKKECKRIPGKAAAKKTQPSHTAKKQKQTNGTTVITTEKPDQRESEAVVGQDDSDIIIIGAAAGGGVLVLILIVLLIFCLVQRRRKMEGNHSENNAGLNVVEMSANTIDIEEKDNIHDKSLKQTQNNRDKESQQEYIYAQPNKQKKVKKPSKKEISEPQNLYDNIAVDLENEEETFEESNVDILLLENLDEGTISFIETDVKAPTSDTYYNTASLIRSRILITNLLEYIKVKTDYEHEFEKLPKGLTRTCNEGLKRRNIAKNRYNGIYAYDATRVVLKSKNYINANYIDGYKKSQAYIASLGPTNSAMNKFESFWEMIWQERTKKIVMLTHLEENGKMKCEQYWPKQGESKRYSDFSVSCMDEKEFSEFVVREFTISRGSETRSLSQYHYIAWPDKTVPETVASLVEFRDKVEQRQTMEAGPMIVHCSAGIGRTGTYIALDILIREGREEGSVDIFGCVTALRGQRAHMVQNSEQYIFLHQCVMYALTCDPQPLSNTTIGHVMTDDKISDQYQIFMEVQINSRTDRKSVTVNTKRKENRKGADIPGDDNRVRLTFTKHDYINAVYLNGYLMANKFIIAQTPLPNTVENFVSMLYEEKCPSVVCLDEENIDDKTVGQYLPPANKVSRFGQFKVACMSSNSTEDFVSRELKISRIGSSTSQEISVLHYQFKGWNSSENVPKSAKSFLNLVLDIEKARNTRRSQQPTVVHCLTGADRSGLFCGVSILVEKFFVEKELSVVNTVCQVRCRRRSAFQDLVHLRFCYGCVKEMPKIPGSSDYYNVIKI